MNDIQRALHGAIGLTEYGFAAFPCRPDKKPATPHGFKDATADRAALESLWRRHPGVLIGLPTGAENGFDALDIDPRHGGDAWHDAHRSRLPATRMHRTRSGGWHILFLHHPSVRNTESRIAQGVDTRGEGGYVIWWPGFGGETVVGDAPGAWPDWLLLALQLRPQPAPAPLPPLKLKADGIAQDRALAMIAGALARVRTAPQGKRHYAVRAAARTIGGLMHVASISESDAVERLAEAARQAGAVDIDNAKRTAAWGIESGRRAPFDLGAAR